ncbi:MAG: von Willebrand factor type A domain-containing protein, partial [Planctomycetes bacterium]|nr:von Willebrand factor type A domain-containing protein [Planctomycetota bacterium]
MQSPEYSRDELKRLDDLAEEIRLWRQQALQDADGIDDVTLANYVSGSLDADSRHDIDAKLAGSPELREIVELVESVVAEGAWKAETDTPVVALRPPIGQQTDAKPPVSPVRRVLTMRTNFWITALAAMAASVLIFCIPTYLALRSVENARAQLRIAENARAEAKAVAALRQAESARTAAEHERNVAKSAEQTALAQRLYLSDMKLAAKLSERDKFPTVAFSPDGALLVAGSQDGRVRIWDASGNGFHYLAEDAFRFDLNPRDARFNTEAYDRIYENPFLPVRENPLSTFSIDVDTASYSNARRFLSEGKLPPADAVRIEEFINYFNYDYAPPQDETPFAVHVEIAPCPWQPQHKLAKIGLKGKVVERAQRPPVNLVFLLDVSGSMKPANKLPLVKSSMSTLVEHL